MYFRLVLSHCEMMSKKGRWDKVCWMVEIRKLIARLKFRNVFYLVNWGKLYNQHSKINCHVKVDNMEERIFILRINSRWCIL